MKRALLSAILMICLGCAHPGSVPLPVNAINTFDADSYSALIVAQATLTTFKSNSTLMAIPEGKTIVNQAIQDYDIALNSWKAYHAGGGNSAAVTLALTSLSTDILKAQGIIPTVGGK